MSDPAYSKPSPPRPVEDQSWRRHHTGRANYGQRSSITSGTSRRRRKRIMRGEWFNQLTIKHQYRQRIVLGVDA